MTSAQAEAPLEYRRYRAPSADGATFFDPPLAQAPDRIRANEALRAGWNCDVQGRSLARLACEARGELLAAALDYTRSYTDVDAPTSADRLLLAGHQPQLFHPAVWMKNFVLAAIARENGAVAVNLTIDSDTVDRASVRMPTGTVESPVARDVPFDDDTSRIPYEERAIADRSVFDSFADRASEALAPLVRDPLVNELWPLVRGRADATGNLGTAVAQGRHQLERQWGLTTLEMSQSEICRLESFGWFAAHVIARLPRFRDVYNDSLLEYRRVNHIRSANHPVPQLEVSDGWYEAPFWIWTADDPRRRRLYARHAGGRIVLGDRAGLELPLPLTADGDASRAAELLSHLDERGIRLRTRALTTTLFSRLFLGDLFVHGIGGAKYDQLTDLLMARFWGVAPPSFQVVSGTLHLPIPRTRPETDEVQRIERRIRDGAFNPERILAPRAIDSDAELARLVAKKRSWIAAPVTSAAVARARHHAIVETNAELARLAEPARRELYEARDRAIARRRAEALLSWREYAFCLYPAATLWDFLLAFLPQSP